MEQDEEFKEQVKEMVGGMLMLITKEPNKIRYLYYNCHLIQSSYIIPSTDFPGACKRLEGGG
jgi:hypothetical protein